MTLQGPALMPRRKQHLIDDEGSRRRGPRSGTEQACQETTTPRDGSNDPSSDLSLCGILPATDRYPSQRIAETWHGLGGGAFLFVEVRQGDTRDILIDP
jgi:hypothetical protein